MSAAPKPFDRDTLEQAFQRLGELAVAAQKIVEISVYGGSALVLTMNYRASTHDVDAVFERDRAFVRQAAETVSEEFGWPQDWLNDGVKGFLSGHDADATAKALFRTFPSEDHPGLRVFVASPSYLFAMKCLAMRVGGVDENPDVEDIRQLAHVLSIKSVEQALQIVSRYYPLQRLPPKTHFGLEEIFGGSAG